MSELSSAPVGALRTDDHVRGDGPLVLFHGDFSCPRCALAWRRLNEPPARPLRLVVRHFALKAKHPRALLLAHATEAAAAQDAFWPFADALMADPARTEDPHLWAHVERLGLDLDRFEADRRSEAVAERVQRDVREALRGGVVVTPTLRGPDGEIHAGPPSPELVRHWGDFGSTE